MTVIAPKADLAEIRRGLRVFFAPGDVVEIRALDVNGKTYAGYFNDYDRLANEAASLSGQAAGVYVVLNLLNPDLMARYRNRITMSPKNLTQDADITRRRWLPIDVDARRPSGISSTDQEHATAIATAQEIKNYLIGEFGFPADSIITGDSGNGAHVPIRIDLPVDSESETIVKTCLKAIAAKFDNHHVSIDQSVFNAARIWKLPGTLACKGDHIPDRPHRIARLLDVPATITAAPLEVLKALAASVQEPAAPVRTSGVYRGSGQTFDLMRWLAKYHIPIKRIDDYHGGKRIILEACGFHPQHGGTSAAIIQGADGRLGYSCQYAGCAGKHWADYRRLYEPDYPNRRNGYPEQAAKVTNSGLALTDLGNAERLVQACGGVIRYVHERKLWLLWNGIKWEWDNADDTGVMGLAKQTARDILKEVTPDMDKDAYKNLLKWAQGSESEKRLRAMVSLAKNEPGITVSIRALNTDLYLFNVLNGTLDLRSGNILYHDPKHLITMLAAVHFDPVEICPEWDKFLSLVMSGDTDKIRYLRDLSGYCLTGDTKTQVVPFCHGGGGNGKSTFWSLIRRVMGDYAIEVDPDVFLISRQHFKDGGTRETLADLFGKRLATATEIEEDRQLSINLLKAITGGEDITGDRKYEHNVRFKPTFKVILSGNNEPTVHDSTDGAWRRFKKIPFSVKIANPVEGFDEYLARELPGILNWMLQGCLSWQRQGLSEPDDVRNATAEYRRDQDHLNAFLEDQCKLALLLKVAKKDFKTTYLKWCEANSINAYSDKTLKQKLVSHGVKEGHSGGVKEWRGIGLEKNDGNNVTDGQKGTVGTDGTTSDINFPRENELEKVLVKTSTTETSGTNFDRVAAVLGLTADQAVTIWRQQGAPIIHLGPGVNCLDLGKLLSRMDVTPEHLAVVKTWLQEHRSGEQC